jgi:hypothetical protein
MNAMAARLLGGFLVLALAGCGGIALGPTSPLAGTWYGAGRTPGSNLFTGKIVFDRDGDLVELDGESYQDTILLRFDGKPRRDADGNTYTARAQTTIDGEGFRVDGRVEYTDGKYEGVTYITVEGSVRYGAMDATIEIDFPGGGSRLFYLDATRR